MGWGCGEMEGREGRGVSLLVVVVMVVVVRRRRRRGRRSSWRRGKGGRESTQAYTYVCDCVWACTHAHTHTQARMMTAAH